MQFRPRLRLTSPQPRMAQALVERHAREEIRMRVSAELTDAVRACMLAQGLTNEAGANATEVWLLEDPGRAEIAIYFNDGRAAVPGTTHFHEDDGPPSWDGAREPIDELGAAFKAYIEGQYPRIRYEENLLEGVTLKADTADTLIEALNEGLIRPINPQWCVDLQAIRQEMASAHGVDMAATRSR